MQDDPTLSCPLSWILRRKCWGLGKGFGTTGRYQSWAFYLLHLNFALWQSLPLWRLWSLGGSWLLLLPG